VTAAYFAAAKRLGARFEFERTVSEVHVEGGRIAGVTTQAGRIDAPIVINAAGPHAAAIGTLAGVAIPVVPVRRQIFTTQPVDWLPPDFPMVVDMATGVYMHKESGGLLLGLADKDEPPSLDVHIDFDFRDRVFLAAMERLPRLEDASYRAGWGGSYEVTPDHNAILGPSGIDGFLLANGFSGHGFMHAPGVGMLLADWVIDGRPRFDVSELGLARFTGRPLEVEANVI
jgi:sarcosine oxidase subunit beta